MGLDTLAATIEEEPDTVEDVFEPICCRGLLRDTRGMATLYLSLFLSGKPDLEQQALHSIPKAINSRRTMPTFCLCKP